MNETWIEPLEIVRDVDSYVGNELCQAVKYDNRTPLDEGGIFSLHRLAARIYASGYEAGARSEGTRADGQRQRKSDHATAAKRAEFRTCELSPEEIQRAENACRTCASCDAGMAAGCSCDPEPRAVIAYLLTEVERLSAPASPESETPR